MDLAGWTYNLLLNSLGYGLLPLLLPGAAKDPLFRRGRLGRYDMTLPHTTGPRIWSHAASVGEVTGAVPTLCALRGQLPQATVFLTVATLQGYRFARTQLPDWAHVLPFPLDYPKAVNRALDLIKPDLYVAFESEFWPNLFRALACRRVPAVLLNGRLSAKSLRSYLLLKPLFRPVFRQFRWLAMHAAEDLQNILKLEAPPERTLLLGSSKYDGLFLRLHPERVAVLRETLDLTAGVPVVVGGSLRGTECSGLLQVFHELRRIEPGAVGIFAPRHLERIPEMMRWLADRAIPFHLLSHLESSAGRSQRQASVILVDRIGVLFDLYALGDLIFCGGTLEPIGGHNILEPAAWERAVFYGPHLQKVANEHNILRAHEASFVVRDTDELLRQWSHWIERPLELRLQGKKAAEALGKLSGVAAKQVTLIMDVLEEKTRGQGAVPAGGPT